MNHRVASKANDASNYRDHDENFLDLSIDDQAEVDDNAFPKVIHDENFRVDQSQGENIVRRELFITSPYRS